MPHLFALLIALSAVMLNQEHSGCIREASLVALDASSRQPVPVDVVGEISEYRDSLQENSSITGILRHRDKIPDPAFSRFSTLSCHLNPQSKSYKGFLFPLLV